MQDFVSGFFLLYFLFWVLGLAAVIVSVIYFINKRRKEKIEEEDILNDDNL